MVDPLNCFYFQPVLHDWCNIDHGMCYPVCGIEHIKESFLLIGKSICYITVNINKELKFKMNTTFDIIMLNDI